MVHLSPNLFKFQRKFIDSLRLHVCGGRGGQGFPKFDGVGGRGGNVYVKAKNKCTLKSLKFTFPSQRFKAGKGEDSRRYRILGNKGADVYIDCPIGVSIITDQSRVLGDLNEEGDEVLVARGGNGGCLQSDYLGQDGQHHSVTLDLKIVADIGFVGYPNAGKSTLLRALSRAQPKIASYPFTTVHPNIGILQYDDFRTISAADLPGLIEGAHLNYGMGHKFLKHCLRTNILLFVIDLQGFRLSPNHHTRNAIETILYLNKELEMYDPELLLKPAILTVNKIDTDENSEKFNLLKEQLARIEEHAEKLPSEYRPNHIIKFDAVVPISAKMRQNIDELKRKLRAIIDIHHEQKLMLETQKVKQETEISNNNDDNSVMYV